MTMIAIGH